MTRRVGMLIGLLCVGGSLLTACSSGSASSSTTTTAPATTSTRSPAPSTTSAPATTTTTGSGGPTQCATATLTASVYGSSGAAGTIETTVALTSSAATACTLAGYPGLQMLSSTGALLPTNVVRGGSYQFTTMAPTSVTVAPGQAVYFNMGYSDVPSGAQTSCPSSATLHVTPPNSYTSVSLSAQLSPCDNGSITVSPVFAGTGAAANTRAPA
ncbi:MAG: DUF4232 domain-containing protein [Acidimicrobiales bacterium]